MKKYLIAMFATAAVSLAGCGMMSEDHMMMMEEMSGQMNQMQSDINANATAAAHAKEMAEEAMGKASMMDMTKMPDSHKHMMHKKHMMK